MRRKEYDTRFERYSMTDYMLAQVAMYIVQVNSTKKKKFKIEDFLLKFREEGKKRLMTKEEVCRIGKSWALGLAGIARKNKKGKKK